MIHAGLQAAEKGIPFLPLRGILGSDLVRHRADWRVIDNPSAEATIRSSWCRRSGPMSLCSTPPAADRAGNVWIGVRRELMLMAHAARRTLVTVEEIVEDDLLADDVTAAGTIPALYVSAIATAPRGRLAGRARGAYPPDRRASASLRRDGADRGRASRATSTHFVLERAPAE